MEQRPSTVGPYDIAIAAAIRAAAAERQVTQTEVTAKTDIPHRTLIRYWNGKTPIPVGKFIDITSAIGVRAEDIIEAARVIINRAEQNGRR